MKTKKLLYSTLIIIILSMIGCAEDYTDINALAGSTWRCGYFNGYSAYSIMEYKEFKFVSTDSVEEWNKIKHKSVRKIEKLHYTLINDTIKLYPKYHDPYIPLPMLIVNNGKLNYSYNGYSFTFSRIRKYIFF